MTINSEVCIDNLFDNPLFLEAIGKQDFLRLESLIRQSGNVLLKENFDMINELPTIIRLKEENKGEDINIIESYKRNKIKQFNHEIAKLAELIVKSNKGIFPKIQIDDESLISDIRDESIDVVSLYHSIGGKKIKRHRYDCNEYVGLEKDEVNFFKTIRNGDLCAVKEIIETGLNLNIETEDGTTALMIAVEYGQYEVVNELLSCDADIHARESADVESIGMGVSAMNLAALNEDYQMIELLLKWGADINEQAGVDGKSPFLIAVCSGDYDYMDFVLGKGANINIELYNGKTGLIHAVLTDDKKLINYLLDNGADINHRNITGLTALEVAKDYVHTEMVDFLIEAGALGEDRMLEHLVAYRQDLYRWDNDIAYAYYHWSTDDGFSHFLIYGIGYLNKYLALSELRRFYIRKKGVECIETYVGDDHHWFRYNRSENSKGVDERFNSVGHDLRVWGDLVVTSEKICGTPNAVYLFEPAQSEEFDFEGRFRKLSDFFLQYVSIVKENIKSEVPSVNISFRVSRYSEKGCDFLGAYCERASVNVKDEHEKLITDFLTCYFIY